jgi:hypothetical protein
LLPKKAGDCGVRLFFSGFFGPCRLDMRTGTAQPFRGLVIAGFLIAFLLFTGSGNAETLELAQGWNLFSLPKLPPDREVSQVFAGVLERVQVVWGYDNEGKRWQRYVPQKGDNTLSTLELTCGYWILLDEGVSIDISGWAPVTAPRMTLYPAWNLVGYLEEDGAEAAEKLDNPTIRYKWGGIWSWEALESPLGWREKQRYFGDLPFSPLVTMHRGRAYWISILPWAGPFEYNPFPPGILVSPSSIDFGTVASGDSSARQVTISSIGSGALTIQSVGITGTDRGRFSHTTACGVVAPASSCVVDVSFSPASEGPHEAALLVTSDDPLKDVVRVPLTGNGGRHPDAIRTYHIGDTFVYDTIGKRLGMQARGPVTNILVEEVTNPEGVVCTSMVMTGTLVYFGGTIPVDGKTLYYQDGEGSLYECGRYSNEAGQYVFVENRPETPNGVSLILQSPVVVGSSVSGVTYYTNGTWRDCTSTITARENVVTGAGIFSAFRETGTCTASGGSTTTSTRWFYPQIFYVKTVETISGAEVTATLDSYTFAP